MDRLQQIANEIWRIHRRLNLRPTLDDAIRSGDLLREAKAIVPFGKWEIWLAGQGIERRTAQLHMEIAANKPTRDVLRLTKQDSHLGIRAFVTLMREIRLSARQEVKDQARTEAAERGAAVQSPDKRYRVIHADARKYAWPTDIDHIMTDPPWKDREAYEWLSSFSASHLRDGGVLMVQLQNPYLLDRAKLIEAAGLIYRLTCDIVLPPNRHPVRGPLEFSTNWNPVLVFTKGKPDIKGWRLVSDTFTVGRKEKDLHDWQQPERPFFRWIDSHTRVDELICDPFCGSGTIGAMAKAVGSRRYLGTDAVKKTVLIARDRIARQPEGQIPSEAT